MPNHLNAKPPRATWCLDPPRYDRGECGWPDCGCPDDGPTDAEIESRDRAVKEALRLVRIAEASTRLRLLANKAHGELPKGYTYGSLQFEVDLTVVLDLADSMVTLLARG